MAESTGLAGPINIAIDSFGNLYVVEFGDTDIVSITPDAVITTFISANANFFPQGVTISPSNILYFNSYDSTSPGSDVYIYKYDFPVCFNENTKILCLNDLLEEEYIPIQHLKKGDMVKTYLHGYRKVDLTHKGILFNNPNERRKCMYKMEKTDKNGLLEDLIITGGHSILVDSISESEKEKLYKLGLHDYADKIDDKYLVLASVSDHFIPLINNNIYNYYHFTLESDDDKQRFGIWANGILTETTCNNYLLKHK